MQEKPCWILARSNEFLELSRKEEGRALYQPLKARFPIVPAAPVVLEGRRVSQAQEPASATLAQCNPAQCTSLAHASTPRMLRDLTPRVRQKPQACLIPLCLASGNTFSLELSVRAVWTAEARGTSGEVEAGDGSDGEL